MSPLLLLRDLYVSKFSINIMEFTIVKDTETLVQKKKRKREIKREKVN